MCIYPLRSGETSAFLGIISTDMQRQRRYMYLRAFHFCAKCTFTIHANTLKEAHPEHREQLFNGWGIQFEGLKAVVNLHCRFAQEYCLSSLVLFRAEKQVG